MIVYIHYIVIIQMVSIIIGFQTARLELFSDYEVMDTDPIISSALDIYADESTTCSEFGEILKMSSSDDNVKVSLKICFMIY